MKRIGILTSGGDAPGMNAAIRAAVRTACVRGVECLGITDGYTGLLVGPLHPLGPRAVSNIIQRGGTILGTSRCDEFKSVEGRRRGAERLREAGIDALVVIGGDGSFRGADRLAIESGMAVIGVPGTIDNDIAGTDTTIGYDTAVNTAVDAIDKIRDTAASHSRVFFIEVMGRHAGFIALEAAIGGGAEEVILPEEETTIEVVCERLREGLARGKSSSIVIVAEGHPLGGAAAVAKRVEAVLPVDTKTTILGHIQRGGRPTARDRVLASRLGAAAIDRLLAGEAGVMVGELNGRVATTPLPETWSRRKPLDAALLRLARELSA
jgi:6-phosphofructokinase 1